TISYHLLQFCLLRFIQVLINFTRQRFKKLGALSTLLLWREFVVFIDSAHLLALFFENRINLTLLRRCQIQFFGKTLFHTHALMLSRFVSRTLVLSHFIAGTLRALLRIHGE